MGNMLTTNASLDAANSHNPKQRKKRARTTRRECTHQSGQHFWDYMSSTADNIYLGRKDIVKPY